MTSPKKPNKYSYDRFDSQGVRVGQAALDILQKEQPQMTAEEMMEEMGKGVVSYIQDTAEKAYKEYDEDFFIIHIFRKTLGVMDVDNVMSQKAVAFVKGPKDPAWYMDVLPNPTKSLYEVDRKNGIIKLLWSVPGWEDCKSIKKNPDIYDPDLVEWVKAATSDV